MTRLSIFYALNHPRYRTNVSKTTEVIIVFNNINLIDIGDMITNYISERNTIHQSNSVVAKNIDLYAVGCMMDVRRYYDHVQSMITI